MFFGEILGYVKDSEDVSGNILFFIDVGSTERNLSGSGDGSAQAAGIIDPPGESAKLAWLGVPPSPFPEFNREVAWVIFPQQFLNNGHCPGRRLIFS